MTTTSASEHTLSRIYQDRPDAVSDLFHNLCSSLFVSARSSQSRVEAFLTHDGHQQYLGRRKPAPWAASDSRASEDSGEGTIVRLTNPDDISNYVASSTVLRVYFIRQANSYSTLLISQDLYQTLSDVANIPNSFSEYFLYFGRRESEVEIAPPPSSWRQTGSRAENLYSIRYVDRNNRTDIAETSARWSFRQCAVYSRTDGMRTACTWVFVTLSPKVQTSVTRILRDTAGAQSINPLHIHFIIYKNLVSHWRPYLVALNEEVEQHAAELLGASPDNQGPMSMADSGERQALLILENKVLSCQLAISATMDDIGSWIDAVPELVKSSDGYTDGERLHLRQGFTALASQLKAASLRLEHLRSRLQGITSLVSSFLDLSNGFALQELAKESRAENEEMLKLNNRMHTLAEKTTQDAAAVKVLTILTLIYLPVTVMSNFFSTSFVGTAGDQDHIFVTRDWWILLVTSLPLTALTIYIWWVWSNIQAYARYPWWWRYLLR